MPRRWNTTARWPAVKLTGCRFTSEVMCFSRPRNGMYSPNGTSCRLTYAGTGPRPGSHSWPALRSGFSSSAPTSTGRWIARTAAAIVAYIGG